MINFKEKRILVIYYDVIYFLDELHNNFGDVYITHNIDLSLSIFKNYDLIIMDTLLPNKNYSVFYELGHKLFKDIRSIDNTIPILIYTVENNCPISNNRYTELIRKPITTDKDKSYGFLRKRDIRSSVAYVYDYFYSESEIRLKKLEENRIMKAGDKLICIKNFIYWQKYFSCVFFFTGFGIYY